ncbi:MAG TPA: LacI family DNA-binding transcriptional regulator [Polyangiaceae bacterium]|nr:LacI family DNA-binding transcriptional regulator [Polyangiaceae bacterium]
MRTQRATIRDVAQRAGVSTATVSFVLNDNPNESISAGVRRRVLEAARAVNYHASAAAAGLARKRIHNVGIVFYKSDDLLANQFYSSVVQGAVKEAIERGYNLLFSYIDTTYKSPQDLPKIVREKNAEGVMFMRRIEPRMIRDITSLGIPVVLVDTFPQVRGVNLLQIDNARGGSLAAEHLILLGHSQLAMLLPRSPVPSVEQRLAGFRAAFDKHERRFSRAANLIEAEALSYEAGYDAALKAFARGASVTGLFCANDEMAAGALRAARESGRRVPRDLSVVGFDDVVMSKYSDPPLTTIGVVKEHMGRRAMSRLVELVERVDDRAKLEVAPVDLLVRGSTAKLRAKR